MKKIGNWLSNILLIVVILFSISFVFNTIQMRQNPDQMPSTFGFISLTVLSDSMNPTIKTGDMIVVRNNSEDLKIGDIVTYKTADILITHRIIETKVENNQVLYVTQGDANNSRDPKPIALDQIVGKYQFRIPLAGYVTTYLRGWLGLVAAMGLLMIYFLAIAIKEIKAQLNKAKGTNQKG